MCAALGVSLIDLIPEGGRDGPVSAVPRLTRLPRSAPIMVGAPGAAPVAMADSRVRDARDIPSGSEWHAAQKLSISAAAVRSLACELWGRSL